MSDAPDSHLVELLLRAKHCDAEATNQILDRYRPYLRLVCRLRFPVMCQRREDSSDIVQETLLDATRGFPGFLGESVPEFEGWLLTMLERNLLQSVRTHTSAKRDVRRENDARDGSSSGTVEWHTIRGTDSTPSRTVLRGEAAILLASALEQLPDAQRTAVEMRYLRHFTLDAIAEMMEITKGAVAGLIRRGVEGLKNHLPDELAERS